VDRSRRQEGEEGEENLREAASLFNEFLKTVLRLLFYC